MNRREWILKQITGVTGDSAKSEAILTLLEAEGIVHLGFGDAEVDQILSKFKATFGTTKSTQTDRWAAHRLAQKYGAQAITGIIQMLGEHNTDKFCPVVNNVTELEAKMVSILSFLRKLEKDEVIDV
jgi:hypothetical protein